MSNEEMDHKEEFLSGLPLSWQKHIGTISVCLIIALAIACTFTLHKYIQARDLAQTAVEQRDSTQLMLQEVANSEIKLDTLLRRHSASNVKMVTWFHDNSQFTNENVEMAEGVYNDWLEQNKNDNIEYDRLREQMQKTLDKFNGD